MEVGCIGLVERVRSTVSLVAPTHQFSPSEAPPHSSSQKSVLQQSVPAGCPLWVHSTRSRAKREKDARTRVRGPNFCLQIYNTKNAPGDLLTSQTSLDAYPCRPALKITLLVSYMR